MIDVHLHVEPPRLPGVGALSPLLESPPFEVAAALRREMAAAGVRIALAMGSWHGGVDDPLGIARTTVVGEMAPGLFAIGVADPTRNDADHLARVEAVLAAGRVRALKAYLGYLPFAPDDPGYRPYYELAERYGVPVVFHTGDTYSPRGRLKFAHPLLVDDVAVDHPNVRFVLAHCGNPWLLDAAEVIYKNANVWADLSGLMTAGRSPFPEEQQEEMLRDLRSAVRRAFLYAERPNRFLFGSDWPLVPIAPYADFVRSVAPAVCHELVFEENARELFGL
jgi:predicted TIM-barrel fold metal-dependent hydrolase